jgi:hypothetical protein
MSITYNKPTWENDTGAAINAERLQAISNVLDSLINITGNKAITNISFDKKSDTMTVTYADGTIATIENALQGLPGEKGEKGEKGDRGNDGYSVDTIIHPKTTEGETIVDFIRTDTEEIIGTIIIRDGSGGDMYKAIYDQDDDGIVDKTKALVDDHGRLTTADDLAMRFATQDRSIAQMKIAIEGDAENIAETWNEEETYTVGKIIRRGALYRAIQNVPDGQTPSDHPEYWEAIVLGDEIGNNTTKLSESQDWLKSKNLIPKILNVSGATNTGIFTPNNAYIGTDYIEVEEGETYIISIDGQEVLNRVFFYPSKFTDGFYSDVFQDGVFTVPSGYHYIRLHNSSTNGDLNTKYQMEKGSQATPYQPYSESNVELTEIVNDSADYLKGKNLLSLDMLTNGEIDNDGSVSVNIGGVKSEFISVKPNTVYTASCSKSARRIFICEYDSNNNANRKVSNLEQTSFTVTTASTTTKVRIEYAGNGTNGSIQTNTIASFNPMFCEGTDTNYKPYAKSNVEITKELYDKMPIQITSGTLNVEANSSYKIGTTVFIDVDLTGSRSSGWNSIVKVEDIAIPKQVFSGIGYMESNGLVRPIRITTNGNIMIYAPSTEAQNIKLLMTYSIL